MQSADSERTQSFVYERKENSAVIWRCFSRDTRAVIPKELDGLAVTELAPYAFSSHMDGRMLEAGLRSGKLHVSRSVFDEAWNMQEEASGTEGICAAESALLATENVLWAAERERAVLCGDRLEQIVLPDSVKRIGRYCFYNCDHLRKISFTGALIDWGSGTFTGCHHVREIEVQVPVNQVTMLKDLLDEIPEEVCVTCTGGVDAVLIFPEFYEEGVENTPARILETRVHGDGMRYRNCFKNRQIDFYQYDKWFHRTMLQEAEELMIRMALGRLRFPWELQEAAKEAYESYLAEHAAAYGAFLVKERDLDGIRWALSMLEMREKMRKSEALLQDVQKIMQKGEFAGLQQHEKNGREAFMAAVMDEADRVRFAQAQSLIMEYRHSHLKPKVMKRRRFAL